MKLIATAAATLALTFPLIVAPAAAQEARTGVYPTGSVPIAPYTPGIQLSNGMLFVSGQIPYVDGAIPAEASDGENDVADQTRIVMENVRGVLDEAGYTFDDVVKVTVFLTDMAAYSEFNEVYATYWPEDSMPPARAAVEVAALPGGKPGAPVLAEVSVIAFK